MNKKFAKFTNNFIPPINQNCVLCGAPGHRDICLCENCLKELPFIEKSCRKCGIPIEIQNNRKSNEICGSCLTTPPPNNICVSVLHYQEPVDYLIKHMKYHNQLAIADLMGKLLIDKIKQLDQPRPDQIIPIPLHVSRLQQRGYNQAIEIARPISRAFNVPVNLTDCSRTRKTTPQFDLSPDLRANNLHNAFDIINEIRGKHVAIIDDVMTTGSTVWEFSETLLDSGVERVDIWICARATIR